MFELDEKFFDEVGVNSMPEAERDEFKRHIREEIETRVSERIADGMPTERLEEFEMIIDSSSDFIQNWITSNAPDYKTDDLYKTLVSMNDSVESLQVISDYAGMKWIQLNRPDFSQIMLQVTDEIKKEIHSNIEKIVG